MFLVAAAEQFDLDKIRQELNATGKNTHSIWMEYHSFDLDGACVMLVFRLE